MLSLRNKKNYPQYPQLSGALISGVTGLLHNRIMTPNKQEYLSLSPPKQNSAKRSVDKKRHYFAAAKYKCFTVFDPSSFTVELQWLEHPWLVYHGYLELVLEFLGKNSIAADIIIFWII